MDCCCRGGKEPVALAWRLAHRVGIMLLHQNSKVASRQIKQGNWLGNCLERFFFVTPGSRWRDSVAFAVGR